MNIIWGYSSEEKQISSKLIGQDIKEIKQTFSSLLFPKGVQGVAIVLKEILNSPVLTLSLVIDEKEVFSTSFSPSSATFFFFQTKKRYFAQSKIEVFLSSQEGSVSIPTSSIGTGMGFLKREDDFIATQHFALGLLIP
ncbi:MAG: hypothetical protein ACTSSG_02125 [Candidatus Heimdallarchaeaceae archaeon]